MPNTSQTKGAIPAKSKPKSRINKRQRNRRRNKQKLLNGNQNKSQTQINFSPTASKKGAEIWGEAYLNAVRWHGEHQNNFWRHAAEQLQSENQILRQQLHYVSNIKPETEYETSDEDDEKITIAVKTEEDEVDSKYLEFLQVTIKHREELRLKREAEDKDVFEEEGLTTGTIE